MQFLKKHWFGSLMSTIILAYTVLFVLILVSPKRDLQKRGFIPCTERFIDEATACNDNLCMVKKVVENSFCDFKVIGEGFANWAKGKQSSPWDNYLFKPELEEDDEELKEFHKENPNLIHDIDKLKELNVELNRRLDEESLKEHDFDNENFYYEIEGSSKVLEKANDSIKIVDEEVESEK